MSTTTASHPADLSEQLYLLYQGVASGAVTLTQSLTVARDLPHQADFRDAGLRPMAQGVVGAARQGQTKAAVLQWRLVLETLDHAETDRQRAEVVEGTHAWLYISCSYLFQRPDGRVLADARRRAERVADALLEAGNPALASKILHMAGVVHVDPYVERRDQSNFGAQTADWLARGRSEALDLQLDGDAEMPEPREALQDGVAIFQRAADLRSGRERGQSLKAMADALLWLSTATGAPPDRERLAGVMGEAWTLLDPEKDDVALNMLAQNATSLEIELPERTLAEPDAAELEDLRRHDPRGYLHAITSSASRAADPRAAIAHLRAGLQFAAEIRDEEAMVNLMLRIAGEASKLFDIAAVSPKPPASVEQLTAARETLVSRSAAEGWPPADHALALLALAFAASQVDREDVGTSCLFEALALNVSDQPGLEVALTTALAQMCWYWGATHWKAEQFLDACAQYLNASGLATRLGLPGLARRNFGRAMEAFSQVPEAADTAIVTAAAQSLPYVQSEVPDLAGEIRRFWLLVASRAGFEASREDPLPAILEAAKGASLTIARTAHRRHPVLTRPTVAKALENWQEANAKTFDDSPAPYDDEQLLVAYADALEQPGNTPAEQLANLARRLDRTIASELARGGAAEADVATGIDAIRANLSPDSVLVSVYPCFDERGKTASVTVLATHEGLAIRRASGTMPFMDVAVDGISSNDISGIVARVRRTLIEEGHEDDLAAPLEWAFEYAFGAVADDLRTLHRQGYRHLCVNPHGALHFCPLALLEHDGRPLADDWIVTHLPSVGLLADGEKALTERSGSSAFALSFDDARTGMMPLPAAPEEARRIAQAVGGQAFIDRDATVERFTAALQTNRRVHIATHGRQDPAAPALQTLFLHSGRRQIVPYFAFDVLRQQLDGLDLVTLSACETALGRIDINDNPRGLQAFLFTAGAATIVSCLWPVGDAVAAMFFEQLYRSLADGLSKLQAFAAAQRAVRERYPLRRDWGAFHYSGLWRQT